MKDESKIPSRSEIKANREKLIDALRFGKYKKGKHVLRDIDDNFCCLGVACEILNIKYNPTEIGDCYLYSGRGTIAPREVVNRFGLYWSNGGNRERNKSLAQINDNSESFEPVIKAMENGNYWKSLEEYSE